MIRPKNCPFCGAAGLKSYCIDELNNTFVCKICGEHYFSDGTYAEDTYDINLRSEGCPNCGSKNMRDYHWQGIHKCNGCGYVFKWGHVDYGMPVKYLYCPTCQQKKAVGWQNPNDAEWTCNRCGNHYYLPGYSRQQKSHNNRLQFYDCWNGYSDPDDFPTDGYDIGDGY